MIQRDILHCPKYIFIVQFANIQLVSFCPVSLLMEANDLYCCFFPLYVTTPSDDCIWPFCSGEEAFMWKLSVHKCSSVAEWVSPVLCLRVTLCGPTSSWTLGTAQPCPTPTWAGLRKGSNTCISLLEYSASPPLQRTRWVMTPHHSSCMWHVSLMKQNAYCCAKSWFQWLFCFIVIEILCPSLSFTLHVSILFLWMQYFSSDSAQMSTWTQWWTY